MAQQIDIRDPNGRTLEGAAKHMRILKRRRDYLDSRVERGRREGKDLMYDEYEKEALDWALNELDTLGFEDE